MSHTKRHHQSLYRAVFPEDLSGFIPGNPFSLLLSSEANVVVDDEGFGTALMQNLKQTMEIDAERIIKDNWKHQPAYYRFMSWFSYGLVRFMMGISGYARENIRAGNVRTPEPEE